MAHQEQLTRRGWQVVRLSSETLAVEVVPELGATICSIRRLGDDLEILHQTPWGLPRYGGTGLSGTAEVIRQDLNPGGWQSIFPNGGDTVVVDGADQGQDGEARVALFEPDQDQQQTDLDQTDEGTLRLHARMRRSPIEMTKIIKMDGDQVSVTETVRNVGADEHEVMWGSQLQFGAPLIAPEAEVDCAAGLVHPDATILYDVDYDDVTVWPRTPGASGMINLRTIPKPGSENRMAYLTEFTAGVATITNSTLDCRVELTWDQISLPHLWYQLEAGDTEDHPWFGTGYYLALTPNSSWPAHGLHDARRIASSTLTLASGEERSTTVSLKICTVN
ncbi:hypothetical protein FOE78_09445 [Microlunatus elymi]|uniref:Galactose mutarotase n=1 Tax=Microlunatus elymi TaxID=2596828 RepID=A0A516PY63_9ACTN|nr:hypothetical protein [Microlunatus elymi]QDP96092.1 hypothetical protein FOE78_09445 [Microlunatus elymi]